MTEIREFTDAKKDTFTITFTDELGDMTAIYNERSFQTAINLPRDGNLVLSIVVKKQKIEVPEDFIEELEMAPENPKEAPAQPKPENIKEKVTLNPQSVEPKYEPIINIPPAVNSLSTYDLPVIDYERRFYLTGVEAEALETHYNNLLQKYSSIGYQSSMCICLGTLGEAYLYLDNYPKAKLSLEIGMQIAIRLNDAQLQAELLCTQGLVQARLAQEEQASKYL